MSPQRSASSTSALRRRVGGVERRVGSQLLEPLDDPARPRDLLAVVEPDRGNGALAEQQPLARDVHRGRPFEDPVARSPSARAHARTVAHGCEPLTTKSLAVTAVEDNPDAHAPRGRRRQHPDALRHLPRGGADRALALCDRADVDRRRARLGAEQPARAARRPHARPRRDRRLLDRAGPRGRVGGDGRALPRPRAGGRRAGDPHRHADPDRQPARARRRPPGERDRRARRARRPVRRRRLRHGGQLRHASRPRASTWAA